MITENFQKSSDEVWAEVLRRVVALLRGRGVDAATAEDISQEVAVRAITSGVEYSSADDLMRWASTVAVRLSIDEWRARQRTVVDSALSDGASSADASRQAVHRAQLGEVSAGMARLTPDQRAAIVSGVLGDEASTRTDATRVAVARHRARARLREWTDGLAAGLAGLRWRLRGILGDAQSALAGFAAYAAAAGLMFPAPASAPPKAALVASVREVSLVAPAAGASSRRSVLALARPMPPSSSRASSASARGHEPPWKADHAVAAVPLPDGHQPFIVGTRQNQADDSLVCVGNLRVVPDTCAGKPILPRH